MSETPVLEILKGRKLVVVLALLSLGCLCLPGGLVPTSTPAPEDTASVPAPGKPSSAALNAGPPWLLIETDQGLWAVNPDGSGLTQLTTIDYWHGDLQRAVQPGGDRVAFISPGDYGFNHMALNLLRLPDGNVTKITDLTSPEAEAYTSSAPGDPGFEALRAIGERTSYAWSADGTRLAFSGVMDGPSADIYLYDPASGEVRRISEQAGQDISPSWSPDGDYLLYLAVEGFGSGAGWTMSGVWVADVSGASPTLLYPDSGPGEEINGWLDGTTVLLDSWTHGCGSSNLRLYDVAARQENVLEAGCITSATADGRSGAALYADDSGIYQLTAEDRTPVQVSSEAGGMIVPRQPLDQVFAVSFLGGGMATFGNISEYDHQVSPVNAPARELDVAVYGAIWAWTSQDEDQPGAWITGPGLEIGQIYTGQALLPIWDQDNNLLFFAPQEAVGYALYGTTFWGYYQDLTQLNSLDSRPTQVAWLGY